MSALFSPRLALAASAGAAGAVSFSQADLNHDGVVTYEEAKRVFPRLQPRCSSGRTTRTATG